MITSSVESSENEEQLVDVMTKLISIIGCSQYSYHFISPLSFTQYRSSVFNCLTSLENIDLFNKTEVKKLLIKYAETHDESISLQSLLSNSQIDSTAPYENHCVIPIHGKGTTFALLVCLFPSSQLYRDYQRQQCLYHQAFFKICKKSTELARSLESKPSLSKRESECLKWLTEGKTTWEIGSILNITERTTAFHVANILAKTQSKNRTQAISKCFFNPNISFNN